MATLQGEILNNLLVNNKQQIYKTFTKTLLCSSFSQTWVVKGLRALVLPMQNTCIFQHLNLNIVFLSLSNHFLKQPNKYKQYVLAGVWPYCYKWVCGFIQDWQYNTSASAHYLCYLRGSTSIKFITEQSGKHVRIVRIEKKNV